MEIIIAHSHLNPGGVTRIIESQIDSLYNSTIKVLAGAAEKPETITQRGAELHIIKEQNYLERRIYSPDEARKLLNKILQEIRQHVNTGSILHFHNLNLGKNPIVTYAVYLLAKEGVSVFNHAHDFSEDRPSNQQFFKEILTDIFFQEVNEVLYPKFQNYHYGVLNSADYDRLVSFGIEKERIEWLPNPVHLPETNETKAAAKKTVCQTLSLSSEKILVTYPVRVIQRKNIGEFILLTTLFQHKANFVVTQPPLNPVEIELYQQWVNFCIDQQIPVVFEAGKKCDFLQLINSSDFCITTSAREGFGMAYLEPWLANTPVVGRDIDCITKDFKNDGIQFPALYYKINIPGLKIDFKDLNMKMQQEIIVDIRSGKIEKQKIFEQNPILTTLFNRVDEQIVTQNKNIIKKNYSFKGYGAKLQKRYKKLVR